MRFIFAIISLLAAVFLKITLGNIFFGWIAAFLPVLAVVFWLVRFDFSGALLFAVLAGMIADVFSFFPFGTHLIIFFLLALASQFFKRAFSESRVFLSQGASMAISLVLFSGLAWIVPGLINIFHGV